MTPQMPQIRREKLVFLLVLRECNKVKITVGTIALNLLCNICYLQQFNFFCLQLALLCSPIIIFFPAANSLMAFLAFCLVHVMLLFFSASKVIIIITQ